MGGGVVTDLAGFVVRTFGRGVPFINQAATLLAAADASVDGKPFQKDRYPVQWQKQ